MFHCTGLCPGWSDHDRAVVNVFHCTGLCQVSSDHDRAVVKVFHCTGVCPGCFLVLTECHSSCSHNTSLSHHVHITPP